MKIKTALFLLTLTVLFSASARAEDAQPAMTLEQQAKMVEMQKYMTPNENHKVLDAIIGKWKAQVKFWMSADSQPEITEGTADHHWIMDGRFVQEDFKGVSMGKPFAGMGIMGYDTIKGEYTSIWLDNMATGIMIASAQFDKAAQVFNQSGTMSCPLTMEKARPIRTVWMIVDADHNIYESYMNDKDGKEYRAMEIMYERIK